MSSAFLAHTRRIRVEFQLPDIVKVRLQTTTRYSSALDGATQIFKNEGPAAFYKVTFTVPRKTMYSRSSTCTIHVGYIDAPSRHRRLCISPIRRLPLRPPPIRTKKQHRRPRQSHPLIRPILSFRRLRRRRQLRHFRPHRARPHSLTDAAARSSAPVFRADRLRSQTLRA